MHISKNVENRYHMPDVFRGFLLLNMVVYHILWDLVFLFGIRIEWYEGIFGYLWQQSVCSCFIVLSGFCWQMGRHSLKRGLFLLVAGQLITLVTLLVVPHGRVIFGILTFMGSAMVFMIPLSGLLNRIPAGLGIGVSLCLYLITGSVNKGYLGIGNWMFKELPDSWYSNLFTTYLGFPTPQFWSADYFSIFPWIFLHIMGYYGYTVFINRKWLGWGKGELCSLFRWMGRHSLLIYMMHQPIVYGICMLVLGNRS